jgi:predicted DNA-binding protein (UPF0251 family)/predicted Fe-Mo cluster-binding NifX family protein
MARPISERILDAPIPARIMKPAGVPAKELEEIRLGLDEAEAIRLADLEGLYQEAAARSMGVSRQTFGRIVETARKKIADAVLNGKALRIEGGEVRIQDKEELAALVAIPVRDGLVEPHFGHCEEFRLFRLSNERLSEEPALSNPLSCDCKSGIAAVLAKAGVTHVIAGIIGEGAFRVLRAQGITVIRGASGDARKAARAFFQGKLKDSGLSCQKHDCPSDLR